MRELLVLVAVGAGTYVMRAAFLVLARPAPPAPLARVLPHVGPAVLGAIVAPALLAPHGAITVAGTVPALLAAAGAWVLWHRTRNLPIALFGALALALLTTLVFR
ncbi:AzlD domain-containing protein [Pseudonocardia kujensis]|uniref:AzlD domain-containing protein n=1 Tax=Pseudonocardia kujensis TaxID=1128675 RepID=UPI001E4E18E3|nr:AzlD domain-containing protein [Pseudonocardia kujensis]MCE0766832.1 AzlD domain-containing protein [Pseudonocardia kujensis]